MFGQFQAQSLNELTLIHNVIFKEKLFPFIFFSVVKYRSTIIDLLLFIKLPFNFNDKYCSELELIFVNVYFFSVSDGHNKHSYVMSFN